MHESARFTALKNWVLTTDRGQGVRMVMTGSAAVIALGWLAITNLAAVAGSPRPRTRGRAVSRKARPVPCQRPQNSQSGLNKVFRLLSGPVAAIGGRPAA